ncbi:universal stress protein [Candidatus Thorarchaeota archaeon]|nr:MAG: universal stress protein [Candidatus Thorarchaeota archaeon]
MEEIRYCAPGRIFCKANKILLTVDGSEGSSRAATVAIEVAEMTKSKLYILHVIPTPIVKQVALMSDGDVDEILLKYSRKGQMLLEGVKAVAKESGIEVELILDKGSPSDRILAQVQALGVDLVVIGSHGASGGSHRGLGRSVERVTMNIDVPVLVV